MSRLSPSPACPPPAPPRVSLLMVVRDGAAHIDAALRSARRQTLREIEIVVVDDGSRDATPTIIRRHAEQDPRIVAIPGPRRGLAAVRNLSMQAAMAPYAAVLDADDILHPRHCEALLALAERRGADIAAANMICFSEEEEPQLFARGEEWRAETEIAHARFVASGRLGRDDVSLGYLKPLLRLAAFRKAGLAYDTRLRVGEDYDLLERALAAGLSCAFRPEPTYYYRRHPASTSFRWRAEDLAALIEAERRRTPGAPGGALDRARRERLVSLEDTLAHCRAVAALKQRQVLRAAAALLPRPGAMRLLARSIREGLARRAARAAHPPPQEPPAPLVLVCGQAEPHASVALAAALLAASGCEIRTIGAETLGDPLLTARAGQGAAIILVADGAIADAAAHAIGDGAWFAAPAPACHPLIDHAIAPQAIGDVVALLDRHALADPGLAGPAPASRPRGMAA